MVDKKSVKAAEIRGYLKTRSQFGVSAKEIFEELCNVHGQIEVFKGSYDSINNALKLSRLAVPLLTIWLKKSEAVKYDTKVSVYQIASIVGVSASSEFRVLKRNLKTRRVTARRIPHLLSDKQERVLLETARKLLKMFLKYMYHRKRFSDIITGYKTWVHFFNLLGKLITKYGVPKTVVRPSLAKRLISAENTMIVIFFDILCPIVQHVVPTRNLLLVIL